MTRVSVEWNLLSPSWIPDAIRASVERRLASLWRFLDFYPSPDRPRAGPWRSEEFELRVHEWRFTYEIDVLRGIAIMRQVVGRST